MGAAKVARSMHFEAKKAVHSIGYLYVLNMLLVCYSISLYIFAQNKEVRKSEGIIPSFKAWDAARGRPSCRDGDGV